MERRFQLTWDEEELARAFRVTTKDIREYLTDGRRVSGGNDAIFDEIQDFTLAFRQGCPVGQGASNGCRIFHTLELTEHSYRLSSFQYSEVSG